MQELRSTIHDTCLAVTRYSAIAVHDVDQFFCVNRVEVQTFVSCSTI